MICMLMLSVEFDGMVVVLARRENSNADADRFARDPMAMEQEEEAYFEGDDDDVDDSHVKDLPPLPPTSIPRPGTSGRYSLIGTPTPV